MLSHDVPAWGNVDRVSGSELLEAGDASCAVLIECFLSNRIRLILLHSGV